MSDETKSWIEIAAAIFTGGGVIAFLQWLLGGKKKESTETDKTRAEAESVVLDNRIKEVDYYKHRYEETLIKLEEVQKQLQSITDLYKSGIKDLENVKRELTAQRIRSNFS